MRAAFAKQKVEAEEIKAINSSMVELVDGTKLPRGNLDSLHPNTSALDVGAGDFLISHYHIGTDEWIFRIIKKKDFAENYFFEEPAAPAGTTDEVPVKMTGMLTGEHHAE